MKYTHWRIQRVQTLLKTQVVICFFRNTCTEPRGGGGGGALNFSSYVGSGPASTLHSPKKQEFQETPKIFEILATHKIIFILYNDLKKDPKCLEINPNIVQFSDGPHKISIKSSYPQKYLFFWKPPKILKIKI